jgi:hypothetical protein
MERAGSPGLGPETKTNASKAGPVCGGIAKPLGSADPGCRAQSTATDPLAIPFSIGSEKKVLGVTDSVF